MSHVPEQTIVGRNVGLGSALASFDIVVFLIEQSRLNRTADATPRISTLLLINMIFQIQNLHSIGKYMTISQFIAGIIDDIPKRKQITINTLLCVFVNIFVYLC